MSTAPPPVAGNTVPGLSISVTGKLMLSGVIAVFFLFVIFLILFLRANRYFGANPAHESSSPRFIFPASSTLLAAFHRRALDPTVLKSLPVTIFISSAFKDGMECAVCLSELADGEPVRFLPGCRHGFHLECIDTWFGSNSTCPICRISIKPPAVESKNTNLIGWEQSTAINNRALPVDGSGEGSSSSICSVSRKSGRIMAINIQGIALESSAFALHSSRNVSAVDIKSPNLGSLRPLRRILSMGSRGFGSSCSARGGDIEQGVAAVSPSTTAAGDLDGEGSSSKKNCEGDLCLVVREGRRIAMR
ncbi:E3 ubiquitin-protein ligase EL5-like [Phalaenopsis equestris]|uniref:E3 ubiquitin-protein ligase EL5-like n=1 Tax=Phalaenopsis equestris TaxID=78828 RepID=UPI0009E4650D|nr:E3 ubiquitin-protein ligase EL5-like [Phalaenopsis equestris]